MDALARYPGPARALLFGVIGGGMFLLGGALASPTLALAGLAGVAFVLVVLRYPLIGFYVLAAMVPIERFGRFSDDTAVFEISIMRITGFVLFIVVVLYRAFNRAPLIMTTPLLLWTTYVAIAIGSLTYSSDVVGGQQIASGAFGNILFLLAMSSLVYAGGLNEIVRRADVAIMCWLFASAAICAYSIYDWHFGSGGVGGIPIDDVDPQAGAQLLEHKWSTVWLDTAEEGLSGLSLRRSMGSTSHAAVFGINLLMSIPFFVYVIKVNAHVMLRAAMAMGLALTLYCLLLTNTRAVIAIAVPTVGLCMLRGLIPFRSWMILAGLVIGVVGVSMLPEDVFNRVLNMSNYQVSKSDAMQVRLDYWDAGLRAIADHWLTGVGLGNRKVMLSYTRSAIEGQSTMHNIYLQTALDVGVFGLTAFISFVVVTLLQVERLMRHFKRSGATQAYWMMAAAEILMITVVIFGFQVDVFFFPLKAWWLIASIVVAVHAHEFAGHDLSAALAALRSRWSGMGRMRTA